VHIVTNAPAHVFSSASASGALYRHAEIDAGIVQPKAYDVARRKTVDGLRAFLDKREEKIQEEVAFLKESKVDAVLVDAPFLPW
jgi:L-arabinokinase